MAHLALTSARYRVDESIKCSLRTSFRPPLKLNPKYWVQCRQWTYFERVTESRARGNIRLRMLLHHISWFLWRETLSWPVPAASRARRRHGWGLANWGAFLCLHPCTYFPHRQNYSFPTTSLFTSSPLFHQLDPGASARPLLGPVQSRFKSLFFIIISPYTSAYMSPLSQKHHLYKDNICNCCSWLREASLASKHDFWCVRPFMWTAFVCVFTP